MTFEERLRARRAQIRAQLDGVDVTLLPYYGSARDRIIRPDRALILRRYFIERWLPRLTGDEMKLLVVLRHLLQEFEPGRAYPEKEVNTILARFHPDTAALRRYLVDDEFMERDPTGSLYWRAGGTVDVE